MQRNTAALMEGEFDVLIIGGGAFGAAAAHDASARGLRTALVERGDFGGGASANCFKMVHGGIRYLQHGDLPRLRFSCNERSAWLRTAPHLVRPLPIVIPTYGRGMKGKALLRAGTFVYDQLTRGRNADIPDPARHIDDCRFLSRREVLELFPQIDRPALTGAAVFQDGQMHNPARLVLAMITAAAALGAVPCNYVEALRFIRDGDRVSGALVRDMLSGATFEVRARLVLNAAGPWAESLLRPLLEARPLVFSRDACLTLNRRPAHGYALAVPGLTRDRDALISRSTRHLFLAPWGGRTLLGVWHRVHTDHPDTAHVEAEEIGAWVDEINAACPELAVDVREVSFTNCGLLPFGAAAADGGELSFGKQSHVIDHRRQGFAGIVTVIGNRFTTARGDSQQALDLLLRQLPQAPPAPRTTHMPLTGGDIEDFAALRERFLARWNDRVPQHALDELLSNHGTQAGKVLATDDGCTGLPLVPGTGTLLAEISYAVRHEAAVRLEDVVLRRTALAAGCHPGREALVCTARHMASLLDWSPRQLEMQIDACDEVLCRHLPGASPRTTSFDAAARESMPAPEENIA